MVSTRQGSSTFIRPAPVVSPTTLALVVIAGAAALRLAAYLAVLDDTYLQFRQGDEAYYHEWALAIFDGQWQRGTPFFTTPLYAYFLALAYHVGGQGLAYIRFLNVVLGVGAVVLTWLTARKTLGGYTAVTATALFGFCTAPIYYEWIPEKTTLVLFLTALTFYLLTRARTGRNRLAWLAAGGVAGLAALGHTLLLVAAPAAWFCIASERRGSWRDTVKTLATFSVGVMLGLAPATIHNWLQDGSFLLVSSTGGMTFYIGNGAGNTSGGYSTPPFAVSNANSEEKDFIAEAERRTGRTMKPAEVSSFWFRQAWSDIAADPKLALNRFWRRCRWTLGSEEKTDTRSFEFYKERHRVLGLPLWGFGFVSLLGLVGFTGAEGRRVLLFPAVFALLFVVGISAILVYGRYRLPLLVPLSLSAAGALSRAAELLRQRRAVALAAVGVPAAVLSWFVYSPVLPEEPVNFVTDFSNQGNRFWDQRRYDLALAEYEKALRVRPGNNPALPRLYHALGRIYAQRGDFRRSEELLLEGATRYPTNREIQELLAEVRRRAGRRF